MKGGRYIYVTATSAIARVVPLACSGALAHADRIADFGAFSLVFFYAQLCGFIGSLGLAGAWPLLAKEIRATSIKSILLGLSCALLSATIALLALEYAVPANFRATYKGGLASAVAVLAGYMSWSSWAAADGLNKGGLHYYALTTAAPSVVLPVTLYLSTEFSRFLFFLPLCVAALFIVSVVFLMVIWKKWDDVEGVVNRDDFINRRHLVSIIVPGFLGSACVQAASYLTSLMIASLHGAQSTTMGLLAVALQMRQAILFLPSAIANVLLRDLINKARDPAFLRRAYRLHLHLALAVAAIFLAGSIVLSLSGVLGRYGVDGRLLLQYAPIPLSACLVIVNNFHSRLLQSRSQMWLSMISDIFYAAPLFLLMHWLVSEHGVSAVAIAMVVAGFSQMVLLARVARPC